VCADQVIYSVVETGSIWAASTTMQFDAKRRFPVCDEKPAVRGRFRIKQIGRELGVHYVLEGSMRKSGGRKISSAQVSVPESVNTVATPQQLDLRGNRKCQACPTTTD
jgi:hypothetical protein